MLDATRIYGGLYMGSAPPLGVEVRKAGFDVLVLCAYEIQPSRSELPGVEVLRVRLDDDSSRPVGIDEWQNIVAQGQRVARRLGAGQRVLVTCAMGLNRSGIVAATALASLTGLSGARCVQVVQRRRSVAGQHALYNMAFVNALTHRIPASRSLSIV